MAAHGMLAVKGFGWQTKGLAVGMGRAVEVWVVKERKRKWRKEKERK